MKCIIPCAGESSRMSYVPKHLVQIDGKPLLLRVVDVWKDQVDSFVFVLRRSATYLWEYLPENSIVVFQDEPRGLADAILQSEKCVGDERFVINLGDCLCKGKFSQARYPGVGVWKTNDLTEVNKSYLVSESCGLVDEVVEKPNLKKAKKLMNCGMGVYFFDRMIFNYIRMIKVKPGGGDFTYAIQAMIESGAKVSPIWFDGKYINVTHPEDVKKAEEL